MSLGERLMKLRKEKHLSQEEVAEKLNVTRQTVSKWELDQSTPDFDKIMPICELFGITTNELLTGKKEKQNIEEVDVEQVKMKNRTLGLVAGILLYVISVVWIMIAIPALGLDPVISAGIFLLICGVATCVIVYTRIVYKKEKKPVEEKRQKLFKQVDDIISIFTVTVYLLISFVTGAWHITWMIWLLYALVIAIVKLVFTLRGDQIEE